VFSSRHMDDDAAKKILLDNVKGDLLSEPRKISFTPGRRRKAWNKNCIAIGLSSGFLEPLESTSIALVETAIEKIKMLFPDKSFNPALIEEFNEITLEEYERVRDFIILHYKLSERTDSNFWRECNAMEVPDSLRKKMEIFKARGHFIRYRWEMFQTPSWLAVYTGFNYLPDDYDIAVDTFNEDYLKESFLQMRQSIQALVDDSLTHEEFIAQFCAVEK
ncbi:MAG: tryptophan 7-halogenase, partial [Cellvibrio sp.]|uniref:tryptophan 7-halogenase n=1 Tax=Cellvibrio sp. TaxID=1965322 RepID=UPI0031A7D531